MENTNFSYNDFSNLDNTTNSNLNVQKNHNVNDLKNELIRPKLKFNILLEHNLIIEKFLQYFTLISSPFIKDFPAILINFSQNGIQAKYGFSLEQQAIKHFDDLIKLEQYPYLIYEFKYKFFSSEKTDENNIIRKCIQKIDLNSNKIIYEKLATNFDVLTLAFDKIDFLELTKILENSKFNENSLLNIKIFTQKDEEELKRFLEIITIRKKAIFRNFVPIKIHTMTEPFQKFDENNYVVKIKNFPAKYFLDTILAYIEQIQNEEDLKGKKFLACIKKITSRNRDFLGMHLKFRKGFVEFTLDHNNIEVLDIDHIKKYFIFRKINFLNFGRMVKKIKNYENYVIDWLFLRNHTYIENESLEYNVLNLNLRKKEEFQRDILSSININQSSNNEINDIMELDGKINISFNVLYLEYDPNQGDVQSFLENLE